MKAVFSRQSALFHNAVVTADVQHQTWIVLFFKASGYLGSTQSIPESFPKMIQKTCIPDAEAKPSRKQVDGEFIDTGTDLQGLSANVLYSTAVRQSSDFRECKGLQLNVGNFFNAYVHSKPSRVSDCQFISQPFYT